MRSFELHVQGLADLVAASGEGAIAPLLEALGAAAGIQSPRYDGEHGTIRFAMDEFQEGGRAPSFAQLSALVEAFAEESEHALHVLMINRTVD